MPSVQFFTALAGERRFAHKPTPIVLLHTGVVFLSHTVVAPPVNEVSSFGSGEDQIGPVWNKGLSVERVWPGAGSVMGLVTVVLWLAILAFGVTVLVRERNNVIAIPILVFLGLQFVLHSLYGVETILYSLCMPCNCRYGQI